MRKIKFRFWTGKSMIYSDSYISLYYFFEIISDVELQQFTGLKDKNGKEIYEGDILLFDHNSTNHIVGYEQNGFVLKLENGKIAVYNFNGSHLEVIGNIHENPQLLSTPTAVL